VCPSVRCLSHGTLSPLKRAAEWRLLVTAVKTLPAHAAATLRLCSVHSIIIPASEKYITLELQILLNHYNTRCGELETENSWEGNDREKRYVLRRFRKTQR